MTTVKGKEMRFFSLRLVFTAWCILALSDCPALEDSQENVKLFFFFIIYSQKHLMRTGH